MPGFGGYDSLSEFGDVMGATLNEGSLMCLEYMMFEVFWTVKECLACTVVFCTRLIVFIIFYCLVLKWVLSLHEPDYFW